MGALLQVFYKIPVIGWAVNDALNGKPGAGWWFMLNVLILVLAAVWLFGYAAVIVLALALTAGALITLVVLTAGW